MSTKTSNVKSVSKGKRRGVRELDGTSEDLDKEVCRRLHSFHFHPYESDLLQSAEISKSLVSSCSEAPCSPIRFSKCRTQRKRNTKRFQKRGKRRKTLSLTEMDKLEYCISAGTSSSRRTSMPQKGGSYLMRRQRYDPIGSSCGTKRSNRRKCNGSIPRMISSTSDIQQYLINNDEEPRSSDLTDTSEHTPRNLDFATPTLDEDMEEDSPVLTPVGPHSSSIYMDSCYGDSESDLSETADELGQEGDDEESSFEPCTSSSQVWWDRDGVCSSEDDTFYGSDPSSLDTIIEGLRPVMTEDSWKMFTDSVSEVRMGRDKRKVVFRREKKKVAARKSISRRPQQTRSSSFSPQDVNEEIVKFCQSTEQRLVLPLMTRVNCNLASKLAELYHIDCVQNGGITLKFGVVLLTKTLDTQLPEKEAVSKLLSGYVTNPPGQYIHIPYHMHE